MRQLLPSANAAIQSYLEAQPEVQSFRITMYAPGQSLPDNSPAPNLDTMGISLEISAGEGSYIRVAVFLPSQWNGDLCGLGNGGMAGGIPYGDLRSMTERFYAAVTTDMGTSRGMASGIQNPDVWKDFGHRSTHLMTLFAKEIAGLAYGNAPKSCFFKGGSTGGEQALSLAQKYPEDYDAILCGAPANNRICLHTYFLWNFVHLKDQDGAPLFDRETMMNIHHAAVDFAQSQGDGETGDRFITFPRGESEYIREFVARIGQALSLTQAQQNGLIAVYEGPVNPVTGKRIYNGVPMGSEMYDCGIYTTAKDSEPPHNYPFYWALGSDFDPFSFDFAKDFEKVHAILSPSMDANDPDLSKFFDRGGKIIIISATADPCVPYQDALRYCLRVRQLLGGKKTNDHLKFYLVPSLDHGISCVFPWDVAGPEGESVFDMLVTWYKENRAPKGLQAFLHGYEETQRHTRTVYPIALDDATAEKCPPTASECYL